MSAIQPDSLADFMPSLLSEWNYERNINISPAAVRPYSNKKAWWKCEKGHEWEAVICSRSKGSGCPYCSNHKAWPGYNDLATLRPDLANEWHFKKNGELRPEQFTCGSEKKVWWKCTAGHEWQSTISNRNSGNRCPTCKSKRLSVMTSQRHLSRTGSLQQTNPPLAQEWHPSRNGTLLPSSLTANSSRKVWWLGKCGHEWAASVVNRNRGTACPYCSNQRVLLGYNDLLAKFPEIASEWHPTRNNPLLPSDVIATTGKVVWWKGICGHEWQQAIDKRTVRNQGCPICGKRSQTSFPEQALFYYVKRFFPDAINAYNGIFTNQMELDIYIPSLRIGIEYDGSNWHAENSLLKEQIKYTICQQHNITLIRVREDAKAFMCNSCDHCIPSQRHPSPAVLDNAISLVLAHLGIFCLVNTRKDSVAIRNTYTQGAIVNSLASLRPHLIQEWHPTKNGNLTPDMFSVSSGIKVWWRCSSCGHEWEARIATRSQGVGCQLCGYKQRATSRLSKKVISRGSLQKTNPNLAAEWHIARNLPLTPNSVLATSTKKIWWKCTQCNHEWRTAVYSRNNGSGCPTCAKNKLSIKRHISALQKSGSLASRFPNILDEWDFDRNPNLSPYNVTPGSHKKAWWKCKICGHNWESEVRYRTAGHGCRYCHP